MDAAAAAADNETLVSSAPSLSNTILLTTDADLWPLSRNMFHFPRGERRGSDNVGLQPLGGATCYNREF